MDCPKCGQPNLIAGTMCKYCGYLKGSSTSRLDVYPFTNPRLVDFTEDHTVGVIKTQLGHLCGYIIVSKELFPSDWIDFLKDGVCFDGDINYDLIQQKSNIDIHRGLTFGIEESGYIILGWDHAHFYSDKETTPASVKREGIKAYKQLIKSLGK